MKISVYLLTNNPDERNVIALTSLFNPSFFVVTLLSNCQSSIINVLTKLMIDEPVIILDDSCTSQISPDVITKMITLALKLEDWHICNLGGHIRGSRFYPMGDQPTFLMVVPSKPGAQKVYEFKVMLVSPQGKNVILHHLSTGKRIDQIISSEYLKIITTVPYLFDHNSVSHHHHHPGISFVWFVAIIVITIAILWFVHRRSPNQKSIL